MARIIAIIDVDSEGHTILLDTTERVMVPHGHGDALSVGDEWLPVVDAPHPPTEEEAADIGRPLKLKALGKRK